MQSLNELLFVERGECMECVNAEMANLADIFLVFVPHLHTTYCTFLRTTFKLFVSWHTFWQVSNELGFFLFLHILILGEGECIHHIKCILPLLRTEKRYLESTTFYIQTWYCCVFCIVIHV